MKRLLFFCMALILTPSIVVAGGIRLRYGFVPGQKWECNKEIVTMDKTQVFKKDKHTILYTVAKGPKQDWVRLTARYINPPAKTPENQNTLSKYDLVFSADVNSSGSVRNIQVQGVDKVAKEKSPRPKSEVFWFPELPEDPLEPGDEFEETDTYSIKDSQTTERIKTRTVFTLNDVSDGRAYFETKTRKTSAVKTPVGNMDCSRSGKGDLTFDLKQGMWIEFVNKSKGKCFGNSEISYIKTITMQQK